MKKSEHYTIAMLAVLASETKNGDKLEVLETMMGDRQLAEFTEKQKEEQA